MQKVFKRPEFDLYDEHVGRNNISVFTRAYFDTFSEKYRKHAFFTSKITLLSTEDYH